MGWVSKTDPSCSLLTDPFRYYAQDDGAEKQKEVKSYTHYYRPRSSQNMIKKIIFNPPATIIFWDDGAKTVVKCQEGEEFDPEKGIAMAYLKHAVGNNTRIKKLIKNAYWAKKEEAK